MWLVGVVFTTPGVSMLLTNQILVMSQRCKDRNIRNAFLTSSFENRDLPKLVLFLTKAQRKGK